MEIELEKAPSQPDDEGNPTDNTVVTPRLRVHELLQRQLDGELRRGADERVRHVAGSPRRRLGPPELRRARPTALSPRESRFSVRSRFA